MSEPPIDLVLARLKTVIRFRRADIEALVRDHTVGAKSA